MQVQWTTINHSETWTLMGALGGVLRTACVCVCRCVLRLMMVWISCGGWTFLPNWPTAFCSYRFVRPSMNCCSRVKGQTSRFWSMLVKFSVKLISVRAGKWMLALKQSFFSLICEAAESVKVHRDGCDFHRCEMFSCLWWCWAFSKLLFLCVSTVGFTLEKVPLLSSADMHRIWGESIEACFHFWLHCSVYISGGFKSFKV